METKTEKTKWYQTTPAKMLALGFIVLVLLIPLEMVKEVINDRIRYANEAEREISRMWSENQIIAGPVLNIPISTYIETKDGSELINKTLHILPDQLNIKGDVDPEKRKKGIFRTVVYSSFLQFEGNFANIDFSEYKHYQFSWEDAYITFGISDNRGIKGDLNLSVNDTTINPKPGVKDKDLFSTGISFYYPLDTEFKTLQFKIDLKLNGSSELSFLPIGKNTFIDITSPWADPSFFGDFLPFDRKVTDDGFTAKWQITELNRTYPQLWTGKAYNVHKQRLGVEFLMMADHYQKSLRSAKYGILFIVLTFLVLIFAELFYKNKVEIFHYILLGFALILFFSMLTALSEHIGFNAAYLLSAVLIVSAIWFFTRGFINNLKMTVILNGVLVLFYVFIFVLLSLKDYAYLAGNIGLFIILSTVMGISRKLKLNQ